MKIAVCFSGMIRTGAICAPALRDWFGKYYDDIDFFMHTWDVSVAKPWHPDCVAIHKGAVPTNITKENTYTLLPELMAAYDGKITSIEIENFNLFERGFHKQFDSFSPLWYSWFKSVQLKRMYETINKIEYDLVVKLRPDIVFNLDPNLGYLFSNYIADALESPHVFFVNSSMPVRIDDIVFISTSKIMDIASAFIINTGVKEFSPGGFINYLADTGITVNEMRPPPGYVVYRPVHVANAVSPYDFETAFNLEGDHYAPESARIILTNGS
tara:strand:- start:957 stop:1766 length:810 start_codon:yes stop_codon:yes gene_type:complete